MNWVIPTPLELAANAVNLLSIFLAARNSLHTWWTGIVGCVLFGLLFFQSHLYADMSLQVFFIATSAWGWIHWGRPHKGSGIGRTRWPWLALFGMIAGLVTAAWAFALSRFTAAAAPIPDSAILSLSVVAQLLLMNRRLESWWFWIAVNAISVPLYFSRSLNVTALFYTAFLVNSIHAAFAWRRLLNTGREGKAAP